MDCWGTYVLGLPCEWAFVKPCCLVLAAEVLAESMGESFHARAGQGGDNQNDRDSTGSRGDDGG